MQLSVGVIALLVFLIGVRLISDIFIVLGDARVQGVVRPAGNPLTALVIGMLATTVVQSSSLTISVIVGASAAGGIPLSVAIPMIMGANIGTSLTSTLVALGHLHRAGEFRRALEVATLHDFFNITVVLVLLPLELAVRPLERAARALVAIVLHPNATTFPSPLSVLVDPISAHMLHALQYRASAGLAVGIAMIYLAVRAFVILVRPVAEAGHSGGLVAVLMGSPLRGFAAGAGLTTIVQSSSVTTAIIVPLAGVHIIELEDVFPYLIGANIGTTFTTMLAAAAIGSTAAMTVAVGHFLVNVIGGAIVYPLRRLPLGLSTWLARGVADRLVSWRVGTRATG